jgi:histidine ammonia-lyase
MRNGQLDAEIMELSGHSLTLETLSRIAAGDCRIVIAPSARRAMEESVKVVQELLEAGDPIYGVTTGFGKFAEHSIPRAAIRKLQRNLVRSHSVGVGENADAGTVRAMLALRVNALAIGASGIRPSTVDLMVDMLNLGVVPRIPEKGSVGASGDLAPLAHLALVVIGEGEAFVDGTLMGGAEALERVGLSPIELEAKEGLALINGTQLMSAIGALAVFEAERLCRAADIIGAMSLEAVRGTNRAFDHRIHALRPHPGQQAVAENLRRLTSDSEMMASHRFGHHKVQDPYSLRCMPQVHGAARDVIGYARRVIEIEMNSVTDNPLVFADTREVISGGNFHGEPVGMAMDGAGIGIAELASISERRIEAMLDPAFSELPPFLTLHAGVDSGFMVSQYTAAALVSENKILAHPATVDSIPTSANQEDHVSMGTIAARKGREILHNAQTVLAIELLCAAEGFDFRRPLKSSDALEAAHQLVRSRVPHVHEDRAMSYDIETARVLIVTGELETAVTDQLGELH